MCTMTRIDFADLISSPKVDSITLCNKIFLFRIKVLILISRIHVNVLLIFISVTFETVKIF